MKSTWTLNENSTGVLKVEIDQKVWKKAQEKALEALSKDLEVQGFRKGHVPESVARKNVSSEQLFTDAVNAVANDAFVFGVTEHKIEPVAQPSLDVETMNEDEVTIIFNVTIKPEVELGDYKGLKVEDEDISVSDADVDAELAKLQEENAELRLKEDKVANGDTVIIDFEGFKEGEAFEGGKGENYTLEIGSNSFIPGFEEALVGMGAEEERNIDLTFPDTYHVEDLKGQPVTFNVKLHEVKERVLPELNEEFVELLDDETITSLDELKASIRRNLEANRKTVEEDRVNEALLLAASENAKVEIPEAMIEEEVNQMFNEFNQRLAQQGMNFELYSQILGQTEEDLRTQMHEDAVKRVRSRLVLEKIAEVEKLDVDEKAIDTEYDNIAEMYGMDVEQVQAILTPDQIKYDLLLRKAIEFIKENRAK